MNSSWPRGCRLPIILPIAFLAMASCSDDPAPIGDSACAGSSGPCAEGPAPPAEVVARLEDCEVRLTWSPVEGATHYRIYRDDEARSLDCVPAGVLEWFDPYPARGFARYRVTSVDLNRAEACRVGLASATSAPVVAGPCPLPDGFAYIAPGTFRMGTPPIEGALPGIEVPRRITLTRGFFLSRHEVTQAEWVQVMGENPSHHVGDDARPVEQVSWYDAIRYCNARSVREGLEPCYDILHPDSGEDFLSMVTWKLEADGYRLPTEAEWEYACRAGSTTDLANGDLRSQGCAHLDPNLDLLGWYCVNSSYVTHPVMRKQPNAWGLFDMHGNVREWCWDRHAPYGDEFVDPRGPDSGHEGVFRGGSASDESYRCRSAYRTFHTPLQNSMQWIGFRVARSAD